MFDLNLAHIHRAERERELLSELRAREILKTAGTTAATDPVPVRPAPSARATTRTRALGR
jgi:hypothetical protein